MNSQKISYNQIENKIRQFKEGVDYRFTNEKYHAPDSNNKGYTSRGYQILSPQLNQEIQEYLKKQTAIFMQFEFEGWGYVSEWNRAKGGKSWEEKHYSSTLDENGNGLSYDYRQNKWDLNIIYLDKPARGRENFNQRYLTAKKVWETKNSPLNNVPPKGTKCWSCYEVISDEDIAAGRYRWETSRLWYKDKLTFFKIFEHVKGVCKPLAYDCALRNNYRYHSELKEIWLEYPNKSHEYSCQDCLNRFWNEVNGNLIYLETWAKERSGEINRTKQVLAEIEARLTKLKESGQFHNCGIKKCCAEHDRPDHSKSINGNKGLITAAPVEAGEEFQEPKKPVLDKQTLLNWMKEKKIKKISRSPQDSEQILIEYDNGELHSLSIVENFPDEWGKYLKQEVSQNPIYLNQPVSRDDQNRWPVGKIAVGSSIIIGFSVIGILVYRWTKKK